MLRIDNLSIKKRPLVNEEIILIGIHYFILWASVARVNRIVLKSCQVVIFGYRDQRT